MRLPTLLLTLTLQMMLTGTTSANPATPPAPKIGTIKTSDGISLTYNQTGPASKSAQNLLFITGWRQAAIEWHKQADYFASAGFRVTTYDMRGHGSSGKPSFGYRISRFASDLDDLLTSLNLKDVTLVGHSMGCSVTWAWWDQFASSRSRVSHIVLVDQASAMVADPTWPAGLAANLSAIFTPEAVYATAADIGNQLSPLVKSMFTPQASPSDIEWVLSQNLKMSDANSASLLIDHAFRDWRDVLPRITVPTLVIGGDVSIFPPAGIKYVASQIPKAKSYIFSAAERGSHFMFWENPAKFNELVREFVTKKK